MRCGLTGCAAAASMAGVTVISHPTARPLGTALDALVAGVLRLDRELRCGWLNLAAAAHAQRPREQALGLDLFELFPAWRAAELSQVLRDGARDGQPRRLVTRWVGAAGTESEFELCLWTVPSGLCVLFHEVSAERARVLRLAAPPPTDGQMRCGGHEFEALRKRVSARLPSSRAALEVASARIELGALVGELQPLLRRCVGAAHRLRVSAAPAPVWIEGERTQLEQMLCLLVKGAADALGAAGTVQLEVAPEAMATLRARGAAERPGAQRACTARPEHDLAALRRVVENQHGRLDVERRVDDAAAFMVYLPRVTEARLETAPPASVAPSPMPSSAAPPQATVLVVDDLAPLGRLLAMALEAGGFRVLSVNAADVALALFHKHRREVDLLVTDLVMPGLSGADLVRAVRQQCPTLPIICTSGHDESEWLAQALPADVRFVPKPFSPTSLVAIARKMLAR